MGKIYLFFIIACLLLYISNYILVRIVKRVTNNNYDILTKKATIKNSTTKKENKKVSFKLNWYMVIIISFIPIANVLLFILLIPMVLGEVRMLIGLNNILKGDI